MIRKAILLAAAACMIYSCGGRQNNNSGAYVTTKNAPGDSTIYGLACDGCTDSVLVLLPYSGGDPVEYNIIEAMKNRRVFGRPQIGDKIALLVSKDKKNVADVVVDVEELKGQWCYLAMPYLRPMPGQSDAQAQKMFRQIPDSVRDSLMIPREYGMELQSGDVARTIGMQYFKEDNDGPIQYPELPIRTGWRLFNCRLLLVSGGLPSAKDPSKKTPVVTDTFKIKMMMKDSLIITNTKGEDFSFYRKKEEKIDIAAKAEEADEAKKDSVKESDD